MLIEQSFAITPFKQLSEKTIEEHKKLYAGYIKHANLILDFIAAPSLEGDIGVYTTNELQRRFSFEWAGIRNHEIYFSLLEGGPSLEAPTLMAQIELQWGSFAAFSKRLEAIALTRGIGWAMLYWDQKTQTLLTAWVDEQHLGQLADCHLIVALDIWEHAYVGDYYPSGKKQYVHDLIEQLNWTKAEAFFVAAKNTH